ncbi:MAG: hypothetical protein Q8J74_12500 [Candidatus Didemnitutus sp.]|nr:hypothetical protein [Candidatus Didemnitutus sp.]
MQLRPRPIFPLALASWRKLVTLVAVAWLVPILVQLVPWSGAQPLSAHLVPVYWAVFATVYFCGGAMGLLVALAMSGAAFFNLGVPAVGPAEVMALELVGFVGFVALLANHWPCLRFAAPVAWLAANGLGVALQWALPVWGSPSNPWELWMTSTTTALGGLGVLLAINVALVELLPKDCDWDSD